MEATDGIAVMLGIHGGKEIRGGFALWAVWRLRQCMKRLLLKRGNMPIPADPLIAGAQALGSSAKDQHPQPNALGSDRIPELFAERAHIAPSLPSKRRARDFSLHLLSGWTWTTAKSTVPRLLRVRMCLDMAPSVENFPPNVQP